MHISLWVLKSLKVVWLETCWGDAKGLGVVGLAERMDEGDKVRKDIQSNLQM